MGPDFKRLVVEAVEDELDDPYRVPQDDIDAMVETLAVDFANGVAFDGLDAHVLVRGWMSDMGDWGMLS